MPGVCSTAAKINSADLLQCALGRPKIDGVNTEDCISFYGSRAKLAEALDLAAPSVYGWGEYPPPLRQLQIEALTNRKLQAEPDVFDTKRKEAA